MAVGTSTSRCRICSRLSMLIFEAYRSDNRQPRRGMEAWRSLSGGPAVAPERLKSPEIILVMRADGIQAVAGERMVANCTPIERSDMVDRVAKILQRSAAKAGEAGDVGLGKSAPIG